jgi:hypothetical protein
MSAHALKLKKKKKKVKKKKKKSIWIYERIKLKEMGGKSKRN